MNGVRIYIFDLPPHSFAGGAMAYVKWAHAAGEQGPNGEQLRRREDFFTSNMCRTWFKQFVSMMLSRTNTVTQTSYRDDASIFAWELINEPRVMGDGYLSICGIRTTAS